MAFESQQQDSIAQINITPLVDVMLVLLVIFMVTTPILQQGVAVDLPRAESGALESHDDSLIVTISREKKLFLNEQLLSVTELEDQLAAVAQKQTNGAVYLRADKEVPYGEVVEIMAAIRQAGITRLGMVTDPLLSEQ